MKPTTVKRLFAVSGNTCAFPRCRNPLIDGDVVIGEICHIRAREKGGPRYDENQTPEERDSFENLVLMCSIHHKIIDTKYQDYPVELLQEIKAKHEKKYKHGLEPSDEIAEKLMLTLNIIGSIVTSVNQQGGQTAHQITNYYQQPTAPEPAVLTPVITSLLTKVDHEAGLDYYDFRVELRNDSPKTVREFRIEVEIPERYMEGTGSFASAVPSRTPGVTMMFRHTQQHFRDFALYHGDSYSVFLLSYILKKHHYLDGITEAIQVRVYTEDQLVSETEYPIAKMLNAERVEMILGPRREAIKKICETARNFIEGDGDLREVAIFLSEEPASGKRSVQVPYNMMTALAQAGWLVIESHDAMAVKLTDAGIRAAS